MRCIQHTLEEGKTCLESLEDCSIGLSDMEEQELNRIAMSSYYLLYR